MKEEILKKLNDIYEAKSLIEINDIMGYTTPEELKDLEDTLNDMIKDYTIYFTKKERYILLKNCKSLKIGRLTVNKKGFGFVVLPKEDDIHIDANNLNGAIHDDIVLCEITNAGIKKEGRIVRIIKRDLDNLVGEITFKNNKIYLNLDDDKRNINVEINEDSAHACVEGHKVLAKITKNLGHNHYLADVLTIIGHKNDPGVDILSIAYKYGFNPDFGPEVEEQLKTIPTEVDPKDLINRHDLTNEMIFTIDGDHTKDVDDAISLGRKGNNYVLGVHIADVSNYVKENTPLGDAAFERGTSSYLADTVIPMIPHQLSNGICSLNEGVVRLAMSCVMEIDETGKTVNYDIFPSYIKSNKKMTYNKVNDILMRDTVAQDYEPFADTLKEMNKLAHILRKMKEKRGYIDFELDEAEIRQDDAGHAIEVIRVVREDGEKMIEDFMIAANECVAQHIYNMDLPFIYRVHENPKPEKVEQFMNMISLLGYKIKGHFTNFTPLDMQNILEQLSDKPEFPVLSSLLLRSMRKAEYSKDNLGHFGLASKAYTHFTSPIRRFPDLTVHRLLKKYLVEHDMSMTTISSLNTSLIEVAEHSSEREVAADSAERDVDDMKMAEYMEGHIGEEFSGIIDTITNFGFFIQLDNLIEGLVHVNTLKGDYFTYVPELLAMIGKNSKKTYRIGDKIKVKCVGANKLTAMIDFELIEPPKKKIGEDTNGNKKQKS